MTWHEIQQDYAAGLAAGLRYRRRLRRQERESRGSARRMLYRSRVALRPRIEKLRVLAELSGQTIQKGGASHGTH